MSVKYKFTWAIFVIVHYDSGLCWNYLEKCYQITVNRPYLHLMETSAVVMALWAKREVKQIQEWMITVPTLQGFFHHSQESAHLLSVQSTKSLVYRLYTFLQLGLWKCIKMYTCNIIPIIVKYTKITTCIIEHSAEGIKWLYNSTFIQRDTIF